MDNKRTLDEMVGSFGIRQLAKTPNGYKGCCFINEDHIDSKPSMHIHVEKGIVKCFSCGAFRPLFDFLIDNGVAFDEAVDFMFLGHQEKREVVGLTEWVLGRKIPKSMVDRGYEITTLQHFKVGYDEVEHRITIPLEYNGILYGVQYRQYPKRFWASDGFVKDSFIYNFEATPERVYTEGFTDTWKIWQNGTKNVSALLTAYPSSGQLAIMSKHKSIILALDNDIAGWKGLFHIQEELGREIDIKVALFPRKDAGECEPEVWKTAIENPISITEFEVQFMNKNIDLYNKLKYAGKTSKNNRARGDY